MDDPRPPEIYDLFPPFVERFTPEIEGLLKVAIAARKFRRIGTAHGFLRVREWILNRLYDTDRTQQVVLMSYEVLSHYYLIVWVPETRKVFHIPADDEVEAEEMLNWSCDKLADPPVGLAVGLPRVLVPEPLT